MIIISRKHKSGKMIKPDPTVDRIMECIPYLDPTENIDLEKLEKMNVTKEVETKGLVTLHIRSDDSPLGNRPIEINLNGINYLLPRDRVATVPWEVAEILKNSASAHSVAPLAEDGVVRAVSDGSGHIVSGMKKVNVARFDIDIEKEDV